jgi:hypothetical protein
MMSKKETRKRSLTIVLVVGIGILVLGLVGLLQDKRLLRTKVGISPSPGPVELAQDWESLPVPGINNDLKEKEEICPSPSPSPVTGEAGGKKVLGLIWPTIETSTCIQGFVGPAPGQYKFPDPIPEVIERSPVGGRTAGDIMRAVCDGNPPIPDCGVTALGCAKTKYSGNKPIIRLAGLYERENGLVKLVPGKIYEAYSDFREGIGGIDVAAVYTAASEGEEEIPVVLWMSVWGLSPTDEQVLREWHPSLVYVAEAAIKHVERHEEAHWGIFRDYFPKYLNLINNPPVPEPMLPYTDTESARRAMKNSFLNKWIEIVDSENHTHDLFHDWEYSRDEGTAAIPLDDMDSIMCYGVKETTRTLGLGVESDATFGAGQVTAELVTTSNASRNMNCPGECEKTYLYMSEVKIKAEADESFDFAGWKPDPSCPCTGESCTLVMNESRSCSAKFEWDGDAGILL